VIPAAVDILAARRRIRGHVDVTPLRQSDWLSSVCGVPVALKLECVQRTGSFKIRGAFNALLSLPKAPASAGGQQIVTASAGNHGRGIALAAEMLGLHATVFAPRDAPEAKLGAIRRHGAGLRADFADYDAAEAAAKQFAQENGRPFISPYSHPDVIAGAGTVGVEILEAAPDIGTIVVPIGGAGLISGVAIAARSISPGIRVVGVELEASHAFLASVRSGRITVIDPRPSIADGLGGNMDPETITFEIVQRFVDDIVIVTEEELKDAMRGLAGEEHVIAEGAGAATTAAILSGKVAARGRVAAIVSGGNIDLRRLIDTLTS
jgi:threonine dehydratase